MKKEPHNSYKDLYEELCGYVEEMCIMAGANPKEVPADAWTLGSAIAKMRDDNKKYKEALQEIGWNIPKRDAPDGRMEYNAFKASKMGHIARKALGYENVPEDRKHIPLAGAPEVFDEPPF
jgi:hypothetical protein